MNVPRKLVEAMLNQDAAKPYGLNQIADYLDNEGGLRGNLMGKRLREFADQLEKLSQEEEGFHD